MSYTEWIKDLGKLPKTAEFCLTDVTERISSGDKTINFVITEAVGEDVNPDSRRGQTKKVCRPRMYLQIETSGMDSAYEGRTEITEPYNQVENNCIRNYGVSLLFFYRYNERLCESVLTSLSHKIGVISQHSSAILESQLGDEIVKMVTSRLSGGDEEGVSLKQLLVNHISGRMFQHVSKPVQKVFNHRGTGDFLVTELHAQEGELSWEYELKTDGKKAIKLRWKDVGLYWDGSEGSTPTQLSELCVRDTFLCLVNLPSFGNMIAERLAKILE